MTDKRIEVYFSVDVESDGPIPGPYSMNSFGVVACAVRSNVDGITKVDIFDPQNQFYAEVKPISENWIPAAFAISGLDRDELVKNGSDPEVAMTEFTQWVLETTKRLGGTKPILVGFPLIFDWMWVYWYMVSFSKDGSPFGFSGGMDIKSMYATKANVTVSASSKRQMPKHLLSKIKHTHNPLDDAMGQAEQFVNTLEWDGK